VSELPKLFFDHPFPDLYADLVVGRAEVLGSDDAFLPDAVAVIAGAKRQWNSEAFAQAPRVKVISRVGIGYDNVDVAAAAAVGVTVCNAPEAPSVSTAEQTIALMMAVGRELPRQQERARAGLAGEPIGSALEFNGLTLGLVGYGRIARRVAVVGRALGMSVIAHDPYLADADVVAAADGCQLTSLREVFAQSDVVSLHVPATPETRHMINSESLSTMKAGVLLVNCARGALIDQEALLAALESGQVWGAGLDVTDPEPLPKGHPLLNHPRVIVTPHVASATGAGRRRLYEHAITNALDFLAGRPTTIVMPPQ
jgi:D-3-phosphoglycerate dehydrogenase / 2-oxoglutarate reductase